MEKLRKLVAIGLNIAVILVALLLGYTMVDRYYSPPAHPSAVAESLLKPGIKLQVKDVDFSKSERNLILALSTTCHFCTESIPFYRRLSVLSSDERKLRMIGAFTQDVETSLKYLKEYDLILDEVIKADTSETMVRGTPTLILADKNGIVLDSWYGKLKAAGESELLTRVLRDEVSGIK